MIDTAELSCFGVGQACVSLTNQNWLQVPAFLDEIGSCPLKAAFWRGVAVGYLQFTVTATQGWIGAWTGTTTNVYCVLNV